MAKQSSQTRESKKAQFAEPVQPKNKLTPVLIVIAAAMIGVVAYLIVSSSGTTEAPVASNATEIRIPLADLEGGKAKFFDHTLSDNKPVRFFAIKSSDGVYRAALDACDVCFHAKKGYRQEGDDMVCNNCGLKFHSALINEVHGGCNPVGLPRTIEGDFLVIKTSELESRGGYF